MPAVTSYSWNQTRQKAIKAFQDELPTAQCEEDCRVAFREHAAAVNRLVDEIGEQVALGKVRSGWAVLRHRLTQPTPDDFEVRDTTERDTRVGMAEAMIRNTGAHYPTEEEMSDALFGYTGPVRAYRQDHVLRDRLLERWRELQPMEVE